MIFDVSAQFEEILERAIKKQIDVLPISYPCKVKAVQDDGVFVEIETLLPKDDCDTETIIPILQSPYFTLPINQGDIGLALNCSYLFDKVIEDEELQESAKSIKQNGLFFVPLVSKKSFKGEVGQTMLTSQDFNSKITLKENTIESTISKDDTIKTSILQTDTEIKIKSSDNTNSVFGSDTITLQATNTTKLDMNTEVVLQSGSTIEAKGVSASLGEILGDLVDALTKMNADPVAGNGAPLASPTLTSTMPQILAKIKGNFK